MPLGFLVNRDGATFFFESRFDETLDAYEDFYTAYRLATPIDVTDEDAVTAVWSALPGAAARIGRVMVSEVRFDETRRRFVDDSAFLRLRDS